MNNRVVEDGVFYAYGATPGYGRLSLSRAREFLEFAKDNPGNYSEIYRQNPTLVLDCLVMFHEREHFVQHQTTIFGALLWRIFQCIKVNICYIGVLIDRSGSTDGVTAPLHIWAKHHGRQHFRQMEALDDHALSSVGSIVQLIDTSNEIEKLISLHELIMGRLHGTNEELEIATSAFLKLQARSGLVPASEPRFYFLTPGKQSAYSTAEVMEAGARLAELFVLKRSKASPAAIQEWRNASIHGVYKPAFDALFALNIDDISVLKAIIDAALCGPIDLTCPELLAKPIALEVLHPGTRFERLLTAAEGYDWEVHNQSSALARVGLIDSLCARAGLPRISKTLAQSCRARFSINANWSGGQFSNEKSANFDMFYERYKQSFDTGVTSGFQLVYERGLQASLERRLCDPFLLAPPAGMGAGPGLPGGLLPLIEWFTDKCGLNPPTFVPFLSDGPAELEENAKFHVGAYIQLIIQLCLLRTVGVGSLASVVEFEQKFIKRLTEDLDESLEPNTTLLIAARELPTTVKRLINDSRELPCELPLDTLTRYATFGEYVSQFIEPPNFTEDEERKIILLPLLFCVMPSWSDTANGGQLDEDVAKSFLIFLQNAQNGESRLLHEVSQLILKLGPQRYLEHAPALTELLGLGAVLNPALKRVMPQEEHASLLKLLFNSAVNIATRNKRGWFGSRKVMSGAKRTAILKLAQDFEFNLSELGKQQRLLIEK